MAYTVTMKRGDPESVYDYSTTLVIADDSEVREYNDGGEPEDNTFGRDWSWVKGELLKAYQAGLRDGAKS